MPALIVVPSACETLIAGMVTVASTPPRPMAPPGWLLPMIGFVLVGGYLAAIINAVIGAVILLIVIGFFKK